MLHIGHRFADDRCLGKGHPQGVPPDALYCRTSRAVLSDKSDSADRVPPPLHLSEVLTAVDFPAVHPDRGSLPRATLHYERPLAGSRESSGHPLPGSSGLTPLRHPGYEKRTSPRCSLTLFLNQQPIEETSQRAVPLVRQRQDQPAVHPDRGAFFIAVSLSHDR